jgi:hypothetical protein
MSQIRLNKTTAMTVWKQACEKTQFFGKLSVLFEYIYIYEIKIDAKIDNRIKKIMIGKSGNVFHIMVYYIDFYKIQHRDVPVSDSFEITEQEYLELEKQIKNKL